MGPVFSFTPRDFFARTSHLKHIELVPVGVREYEAVVARSEGCCFGNDRSAGFPHLVLPLVDFPACVGVQGKYDLVAVFEVGDLAGNICLKNVGQEEVDDEFAGAEEEAGEPFGRSVRLKAECRVEARGPVEIGNSEVGPDFLGIHEEKFHAK
jgi:hypothetical protein